MPVNENKLSVFVDATLEFFDRTEHLDNEVKSNRISIEGSDRMHTFERTFVPFGGHRWMYDRSVVAEGAEPDALRALGRCLIREGERFLKMLGAPEPESVKVSWGGDLRQSGKEPERVCCHFNDEISTLYVNGAQQLICGACGHRFVTVGENGQTVDVTTFDELELVESRKRKLEK